MGLFAVGLSDRSHLQVRATEFSTALRLALPDHEFYKEREEFRQALHQEHEQELEDARERALQMVKEASAKLEAELEASKMALRRDAGVLSERVVETILSRRPA